MIERIPPVDLPACTINVNYPIHFWEYVAAAFGLLVIGMTLTAAIISWLRDRSTAHEIVEAEKRGRESAVINLVGSVYSAGGMRRSPGMASFVDEAIYTRNQLTWLLAECGGELVTRFNARFHGAESKESEYLAPVFVEPTATEQPGTPTGFAG